MRQNLANRLAGGGYWALQIAALSVEVAQYMREQGITMPIGNGTDEEIFIVCGIGAFEHFVNVNLDGDLRMNVKVQMQAQPKLYDKYCQPIDRRQWVALQRNASYKRIGMWHNETLHKHVMTVWTGTDPNGCEPPHLFETVVLAMTQQGPVITNTFKAHNLVEATEAHQEAVRLVKEGTL